MKFSTTLLTTALLITPALSGPISLVQDAGTFAVRKILSTFMNSTQVDKVLTKEVMEPHPFVSKSILAFGHENGEVIIIILE